MKATLKILALGSVIALLAACETDLTESEKIAAKIEGQWRCEEYSSGYKSADDFYDVTIEIYPTDSNKIVIENFYQLGYGVDIIAIVDGMSIEIPSQTTGEGSTIYGSGVVSSNYNKITWNYSVDIGDDMIDEVTATYTRIE
jgi:hypothetical protein